MSLVVQVVPERDGSPAVGHPGRGAAIRSTRSTGLRGVIVGGLLLAALAPLPTAAEGVGDAEGVPETVETLDDILTEPGDEALETEVDETPETLTEDVDGEAVLTEAPWRPDPVGALWRSGVFAGLGQFYNEEWVKGGLLMACEAYTLFNFIRYAVKASDSLRAGRAVTIPEERSPRESEEQRRRRDDYFSAYEEHRVRYETYLWLTVLVIVYSMIDAYVDAHLWDFDVDEDLSVVEDRAYSLRLAPLLGPDGDGGWLTGLALQLTF